MYTYEVTQDDVNRGSLHNQVSVMTQDKNGQPITPLSDGVTIKSLHKTLIPRTGEVICHFYKQGDRI